MDEFEKFMKGITSKGYKVVRTDRKDFGERLVAHWKRTFPRTDESILIYHFSKEEPSIKDFLEFMKDFEKYKKTFSSKFNIKGGYFVTYGSYDKEFNNILRNYKDEEVSNLIKIKSLEKEEPATKKQTGKEKMTGRRKIPKGVRIAVWDKYVGRNKTLGKCYVCKTPIQYFDFDVGHNKAHAKGGSDLIDNLRPICRVCNQAMGTMSIQDYKRKYFGKT